MITDFLYRKNSYTKFRQAIRHFKRLPAFPKRINEIWCLDLVFIDKLSGFDNDVKYLLVCVDVLSRLVRVQSMKSKYASDAVAAFKRKNTKSEQGTEFGEEIKNFCESKDIKIYCFLFSLPFIFCWYSLLQPNQIALPFNSLLMRQKKKKRLLQATSDTADLIEYELAVNRAVRGLRIWAENF